MPWVPKTDFEEEVVNLQPHNDFIFGVLSDPEYSYPRPKAHTEYAANKKIQSKEQQKEYETTGKINAKLHLIQQVQRMASTKPIGEQPTIDDWENNTKIEQETIGMMRYCGMGVSVEQPFNEEVTIATFPVENTIKVVRNGRRKVALFFDDKVFKLQEKVSDTSSGFESCNNSASNKFDNIKTDSLASDSEGDTSLNTTSSLLLNSFGTVEECSDSYSSASSCKKSSSTRFKEERRHYEKLLEDTSLLSLNSSSCSSGQKEKFNSFVTAEETSFWTPVFEDEDIFSKKENWPALSKNNSACGINSTDSNDVLNKTQSTTDGDSEEHKSYKHVRRISFLDRFIKSDDPDTINSTTKSTSTTPPPEPKEPRSYAAIAKNPKDEPKSSQKQKEKKDTSTNVITDFPPFYTTRRMYALKRNAK